MKLAVLLLMLAFSRASGKSPIAESTSKLTNEELLKRAASQLERLSAFRRTREPQMTIAEVSPKENGSRATVSEIRMREEIIDAQKRIDDLRASASAVLRDPRYAAIMQDRTKRSFISGIANKLIGGAVGTVSGLSRGFSDLSSSNSPAEYGPYGHSYEKQFGILDFKKAIINTLIQAIKAIGGGAIAGGGALIKGGGYLVAAKGRLISSAGDAISSLGKSLASSAIIAGPKQVYGHPGYSYDHQVAPHPSLDHSYDGPPPSEDAYSGHEDPYNADHSSYAAPSNDDGVDNDAGVLIVKTTKPGHGTDEEHPPASTIHEINPNLSALEESFGGLPPSAAGPPTGTSTITKIIGILNSGQPTTSDEHHNQHQDVRVNYYSEHQAHETPPSNPSLVTTYGSVPSHDNQGNVNGNNYQDYQNNGQVYDSYGTKLESSSPQLMDVHQPSQDQQQSLALQTQGVLNPHLEVPKIQEFTNFKDSTSISNYNYHGNQQNSEPLKISILDHHNNHLDHQLTDQPQIGSLNSYGVPNYESAPHAINTMIGSVLPMIPHYENYQLNSPVGFGHYPHYPASAGGPAVLGVWGRMSRRTGGRVKKAAFKDSGLEIQRSVGFALTNAKLMRI